MANTPERNILAGDRFLASFDESVVIEGSPFSKYISNLSPIQSDKSLHPSHSFQELNCAPPRVYASPKFSSMNLPNALRRGQFSGSSATDVAESSTLLASKIAVDSNYDEIAPELDCDNMPSAIMMEDNSDAKSGLLCMASSTCGRGGDNPNGFTDLIKNQILVIESQLPLHHPDNGSTGSIVPTYNSKTELSVATSSILPSLVVEMPSVLRIVEQALDVFDTYTAEPEINGASKTHYNIDNIGNGMGGHRQMNHVEHVGNSSDAIADGADMFPDFIPSAQTESNSRRYYGHSSNQSSNPSSIFLLDHSQISTNGWNKSQSAGSLHSTYVFSGQNLTDCFTEIYGDKDDSNLSPQVPSATLFKAATNGDDKTEKTDDGIICPEGPWIPIGCKINRHGLSRRRLVFEPSGEQTENVEVDSMFNGASCADKISADDNQMISCDVKLNSQGTLPGIGLHLNNLATPSLVGRLNSREITIIPAEDLKSTESDSDISGGKTSVLHNAIVPAAKFDADMIEEITKKGRKSTQSVQNKVGKSCRCKKSKCLKLYCECFASGAHCVQGCSCQGCLNKPEHEVIVSGTRKRIETRNPFAFAPKIMKAPEPVLENMVEGSRHTVLARHKTGCNCKKSKCTKKYCECFQGGVGCLSNCRCEGCANSFGKKEGNLQIEIKSPETRDTAEQAENVKNPEIQDDIPSSHVTSMLASKIQSPTTLAPIPPFACSPQSSGISNRNATSDTDIPLPEEKSEKHYMPTIMEDNTPKLFTVDMSPTKSRASSPTIMEDNTPKLVSVDMYPSKSRASVASPKRKRVSPPHLNAGVHLGVRRCRKPLLHPISALQPGGVPPSGGDLETKFS